MNSKPVSIKNIAEELKVSITTVSFVLNGKATEKHISSSVSKKILDYAQLINYRPNQIAQSLRTGKSKILVFIVEDISNRFFAKLARKLEGMFGDRGYKVIFCSNENSDVKSMELIDLFNRRVDGFIITPSPGIKDSVQSLIKQNIPVILFDRFFEEFECNSVTINNKKAVFDGTLHLINNKFKNIAFIATNSVQSHMQDRLSGYKKAISDFDLKPNILLIDANKKSIPDVEIKDFILKNPQIDAVFFGESLLAETGLKVLKESNFKLLQSAGLLSFGDNEMFRLCQAPISCILEPLHDISFSLMELMLDLLKKKDVSESPQKIVLAAELAVRDSTCRRQ